MRATLCLSLLLASSASLAQTQPPKRWRVILDSSAQGRLTLPPGRYFCGSGQSWAPLKGRAAIRVSSLPSCEGAQSLKLELHAFSRAPVYLYENAQLRLRVFSELLAQSEALRGDTRPRLEGLPPLRGRWSQCEGDACDFLFEKPNLGALPGREATLEFLRESPAYLLARTGRAPTAKDKIKLGTPRRWRISSRLAATAMQLGTRALATGRIKQRLQHPLAPLLTDARAFACEGDRMTPSCTPLPSPPTEGHLEVHLSTSLRRRRAFTVQFPFRREVEVISEARPHKGLDVYFQTAHCVYELQQLTRAYAGFSGQEVAFALQVLSDEPQRCPFSQPQRWRSSASAPVVLEPQVRAITGSALALQISHSPQMDPSDAQTIFVPLQLRAPDGRPLLFSTAPQLRLEAGPQVQPEGASAQVYLSSEPTRLRSALSKVSALRKNRVELPFTRGLEGFAIRPAQPQLYEPCEASQGDFLLRGNAFCVRVPAETPTPLQLSLYPLAQADRHALGPEGRPFLSRISWGSRPLQTRLRGARMNFAIDLRRAHLSCDSHLLEHGRAPTALSRDALTRCALRVPLPSDSPAQLFEQLGAQRLELRISLLQRGGPRVPTEPRELLLSGVSSARHRDGQLELPFSFPPALHAQLRGYQKVRFEVRHHPQARYEDEPGRSFPSARLVAHARLLPRGHFGVGDRGVGLRTFLTALTGAAYRIPSGTLSAQSASEFDALAAGQLKAGPMLVLEPWRFSENRPWWFLNPQLHLGVIALNAGPRGLSLPSIVMGVGLRIPSPPQNSALDTDVAAVAWWELSKGPRGVQGSLVLGLGLRFGRWLP